MDTFSKEVLLENANLITTSLCEQIIPQSVCSRHGLAIGAAVAPFVRVLGLICFPVAYPISKVLVFAQHYFIALFKANSLVGLSN